MSNLPLVFIGIDGESIDDKYVLLNSSAGDSLLRRRGIKTKQALQWFFDLQQRRVRGSRTFLVSFSFDLDVNFLFRDLPFPILADFYKGRWVEVDGWRLRYLKQKKLSVRRISKDGRTHKGVVVYDVFSFFGTSFVEAVKQYTGREFALLNWGKSNRENFKWSQIEKIKEYNKLECDLLVVLMELLECSLASVGVTATVLSGPGSVASYLLKRWNVKRVITRFEQGRTKMALWDAFQCASFGSRTEALKLGRIDNVIQYDMNSAFAWAVSQMPVVTYQWHLTDRFLPDRRFAVYKVRWALPHDTYIGVLPWRSKTGGVFYPLSGEGWAWFPEVEFLIKKYPKCVEVIKGFYHVNRPTMLGRYIPDLYAKRLELKARNDPAEKVIKRVLTAIYGKFAQKVGVPIYGCLPWAGLITSLVRRRLLDVVNGQEQKVIAFAIDAVVTQEQLEGLEPGSGLGEFRMDRFDYGYFIMSGLYRLLSDTEEKIGKRGFRQLNWESLLSQLTRFGKAKITYKVFHTFQMSGHPQAAGHADLYKFAYTKDVLTVEPYNLNKRRYRLGAIKDWELDSCDSMPLIYPHAQTLKSSPMLDMSDRVNDSFIEADLQWGE